MSPIPRIKPLSLAVIVALAASVATLPNALAQVSPPEREASRGSFAPIVKRVAPAVVNVYVSRRVEVSASPLAGTPFANDPFFQRFFGGRLGVPRERMQNSLGSGVIVSPTGIVVTNTHVVKGSSTANIRLVLADRREFDAKIVSQDERADIAVLRIEGGDGKFPALEFEDSDAAEVGDRVVAIGNPFGVGQTVTTGIVSALQRTEVGTSDSQVYIQTDAAINPGNSGGALVDMAGRLIGINTAIFSGSGGSHGIGFAIPANVVRLHVEAAIEGRRVERPWLGASLEPVTREIAESLGRDRTAGALVSNIFSGGVAEAAGIMAGDVILAVDGHEVTDPRAVAFRLTTRGVGKTVQFNIVRKGRPLVVEATLRPAPPPDPSDERLLAGPHPLDGALIANLKPAVVYDLGIREKDGVAVLEVKDGTPAARNGLRRGDLILAVGRERITAIDSLEAALRQRPRLWVIAVKRGERLFRLQIAD